MTEPTQFDVTLTFSTGDPETVSRIIMPRVDARTHLSAADGIVRQLGDGDGFSRDDLVEITITLSDPPVARNLLAQHR